MGLTLLAQECRIGSTTYYLANVKANTLIQNVGYASEMENWSDMSIDERMQREIKGDRVAEEIVPYIVNDQDWFFGALIVFVIRRVLFDFGFYINVQKFFGVIRSERSPAVHGQRLPRPIAFRTLHKVLADRMGVFMTDRAHFAANHETV